jgi:hypothetical protein
MATVTFTFAAKTKTFTVSAGSATRFAAWAAAAYPTIPNPAFPGTPGAPATLPNPEPVLSAIDALWAGIVANVKRYEKSLGIAAVATPADLT